MQDLQHELSHLSGQLETVQKSTRTKEQSNKNNLDDIQLQNNSLLKELDVVSTLNEFMKTMDYSLGYLANAHGLSMNAQVSCADVHGY